MLLDYNNNLHLKGAYINLADCELYQNHKTNLMFSMSVVVVPALQYTSENFFWLFYPGLPYHWFNPILKLVY